MRERGATGLAVAAPCREAGHPPADVAAPRAARRHASAAAAAGPATAALAQPGAAHINGVVYHA